jgi:mobilization protein
MIVKMFKSNKQPIKRAFNYLLNQRVNNNTAKLLKGNRELAESLEKLSTAKTKYFSGVLSFAEREKRFTEEEKMEIIEAFERTFCPDDYLRERLNFTWIQHTDKKRLELNFVVNSTFRNDPDKLLKDKKEFYHWHKPQIKRFDAFRDFIDAKYGLASVHDNGSQHIFTMPDYQIKSRDDVETLVEMVLRANMKSNSKLIESRSELIAGMKKFHMNVSREVKGSISVLPEGSKKPIRIKISENADASVFDEMRKKIKEKYDGSNSVAAETKQKHQQRSSSLLERYNNEYKERLQNEYYRNTNSAAATTAKHSHQKYLERNRPNAASNAAATATISVDRKAGIEGLDDINVQFGLERSSKELGRLLKKITERQIAGFAAESIEQTQRICGAIARENGNDESGNHRLSDSVGRLNRVVAERRDLEEEKELGEHIENIVKNEVTDRKEAFRAAIDELKKEYYENKNELNFKNKDLRKQLYSNKRRFEYVNKIVDDINKEIKELKMNFPSSTTTPNKPVDQMSESEFRDWLIQNQLQSSKEAQEKYFQYSLKLQKLQATLRKREDELIELTEVIEYQETELNSLKTQKNLMRIEFIKNCQKTYEDKFKSGFARKQAYEYRPY